MNIAILNQPIGNQRIHEMITCLRNKGATGVDEYCKKLKDNQNSEVLNHLLFEGRAACMFLKYGFQVHLQERPDLQIILNEDIIGVEVKHFKEKQQDIIDEEAISKVNDLLCPYGDLVPTEKVAAWKQIVDCAIKKAKSGVYKEGLPNILIVESDSLSLELMATSAANEYDDEIKATRDPLMSRLSAIMLIDTTGWTDTKGKNIELCKIPRCVIPLSNKLFDVLNKIRSG